MTEAAHTTVIRMRGVNHFYGQGPLRKQVLFGVSAEIHAGEIVIVVGPSGSGKTTLLTLAGALRSVQEGSMEVLGHELRGAKTNALVDIRKDIGFIFQAHNLLGALNAVDNVRTGLTPLRYAAHRTRADSAAMLAEVGLEGRERALPSELSGGQRQRVAIARALVRRPKLVLADEPTASLDGASGREVVEILRQLARRQGCTILLVTHDNRILDIADRVLVLEDGKLGSFSPAMSADAGHLLTALAHVSSSDLHSLWSGLAEPDFLDLLHRLRAEVEQYLNVADFSRRGSAGTFFEALLDSVFQRVAVTIGATSGVLRTGDNIKVRFGDGTAGPNSVSFSIRDREHEIVGQAEFTAKARGAVFTQADERALRDFERPFSLLVEVCRKSWNPETSPGE
jgi:putative ABC transport system ATP-binding protein